MLTGCWQDRDPANSQRIVHPVGSYFTDISRCAFNRTLNLREMFDLRYSYIVMVQFKFQRLILATNKLLLKS